MTAQGIEVDGLVRRLGKNTVLDGLSFEARPGEITGFLGPNGAGKTTTMRVLATLLRPDAGTVRIAGYDVIDDQTAVRQLIGLVTEEVGILDRLTPREQLTLSGRAYGMTHADIAARLKTLSDLLGLDRFIDTRAGKLSKGTRQKVAVARALLHDPPVLLLDEPTANLDVVATSAILGLLHEPAVREGKTVLLATHRLEEAAEHADHIVGIANGRTVVTGSAPEIAAASGASSFAEGFLRMLGEATLETEAGSR